MLAVFSHNVSIPSQYEGGNHGGILILVSYPRVVSELRLNMSSPVCCAVLYVVSCLVASSLLNDIPLKRKRCGDLALFHDGSGASSKKMSCRQVGHSGCLSSHSYRQLR